MRILFAVHGYKPAWRVGGPVISVSSLAEALVREGHEVIVFTTNSNLDEDLNVPCDCPTDVNGVQVWYFRREGMLKRLFPNWSYVAKSIGFLYCPAMVRELDRVVPGVDVVHTHLPFNYPTYAAAHAAFRYGKPLVYHQRGVFDPERLKFRPFKKMLYLKLIELPILKRASALIALTQAEVESYRLLGLSVPCHVIPNGIDADSYSNGGDVEALRMLGVHTHNIVILFMGRVHPIKGADRLLEAFIQIHAKVPDAMLIMAGPDEFGLESSFRQRTDISGLSDRVIFPGMVSGELKRDILIRADLFCLPSDAEGFSMAVLEALASSTAVLLSPGCHFQAVEESGAGRIVDTDPSTLAAGILDMILNRDKLREMGARGRELVRRDYTWEKITDSLLVAYEEGIVRNSAI